MNLSPAKLKAAHCWESSDSVPKNPAATEFRRRLRLRQARWREAHGYPIGSHPIRRGRALGSRIEFEYAVRTGANLLTPGALQAVRVRLASPERHQTLDKDRLWADLLSSMPLCFNLFGDLQGNLNSASSAMKDWGLVHEDAMVAEVRFEWSPGRLDTSYLGNRTAFDVAFLTTKGTSRGVVGVETKYHEVAVREKPPSKKRLDRYRQVMDRARIHVADAETQIVGTGLQQIWQDHLLALSMLTHQSEIWDWVRFVVVYPQGNLTIRQAIDDYTQLLKDRSTFESRTLEELVDEGDVLPPGRRSLLRDRYLGDWDI